MHVFDCLFVSKNNGFMEQMVAYTQQRWMKITRLMYLKKERRNDQAQRVAHYTYK